MRPRKPPSWKEPLRFTILAIVIVGIHMLMRLLHGQPGELPIATAHLFAVPIIIAAIWWSERIILVATITSAAVFCAHLLPPDRFTPREVWFETAMLLAAAAMTVILVRMLRRYLNALNLREHRLRSVFDHIEDPLFIKDRQLRYVEVNPAMLKGLELSREQLIGKTALEVFGAEQGRQLEANDREALAGKSSRQEYSVSLPSGTYQMDTIKGALYDNDGNVIEIFGIARDITERKLAQRVRQEERDKAQMYLDVAGVIIVALDAGGRVTLINRRGCQILGYPENEILGEDWCERFIPQGQREMVRNAFAALIAGQSGPFKYFENEVLTRDGSARTLSWHNTLLRRPDGSIIGTLGSGTDITERKRTEEELRRSHDYLNSILNGMHEGLMVINRDMLVCDANESLAARHGLTKEDMIGRHCHEVIYGRTSPCPEEKRPCPTRTVFETGVPVRSEHTHTLPDGREIIVEAYTFPLFNADGEVELAVQIQDEITERVHAERVREHSEKLAATGRMAARVAHEINNPLAGIKYSFLLIKDAVAPDHPYHAYVARIESEIERIAHIVRNMYDLYTPEQEKPTRFALDDAVNDVAALLAPRCRENETGLDVRMPANPIRVRLPKGSVFQVLFNVIQNAIDASPKGGQVTVTVEPLRGSVRISVADHGSGIPAELHTRVFEPFFTTKRNQDGVGLGLGLSVSRSLVEAMGGTLDFDTEPGNGTVFHINLPAQDPEQETHK